MDERPHQSNDRTDQQHVARRPRHGSADSAFFSGGAVSEEVDDPPDDEDDTDSGCPGLTDVVGKAVDRRDEHDQLLQGVDLDAMESLPFRMPRRRWGLDAVLAPRATHDE